MILNLVRPAFDSKPILSLSMDNADDCGQCHGNDEEGFIAHVEGLELVELNQWVWEQAWINCTWVLRWSNATEEEEEWGRFDPLPGFPAYHRVPWSEAAEKSIREAVKA